MIKALNTASTGMKAQQTNMDVVANNMANVNTTGFKKSRAEFEDLMYQTQLEPSGDASTGSPTGLQTGLGVRTRSVQKDFSLGSAKVTNNPLDLQIEGPGFFGVLMNDGQLGFTRDGAFRQDANGRVVDKNGHPLQPELIFPPDTSSVTISAAGEIQITQGNNPELVALGEIDLYGFVNPAGLKSVGKNLFIPSAGSGLPNPSRPGQDGLGTVAQGQLEASNVNIADEMVNMINAQRAFETNAKVLSAVDQMLQSTNNLR